jgi:hypothetical protein
MASTASRPIVLSCIALPLALAGAPGFPALDRALATAFAPVAPVTAPGDPSNDGSGGLATAVHVSAAAPEAASDLPQTMERPGRDDGGLGAMLPLPRCNCSTSTPRPLR